MLAYYMNLIVCNVLILFILFIVIPVLSLVDVLPLFFGSHRFLGLNINLFLSVLLRIGLTFDTGCVGLRKLGVATRKEKT